MRKKHIRKALLICGLTFLSAMIFTIPIFASINKLSNNAAIAYSNLNDIETNKKIEVTTPKIGIKEQNKANPDNSTEYNQNLSELYHKKSITTKKNAVQRPSLILRTILSLFFVISLMFALAWIYSRIKGLNASAILSGKFQEKNLNVFNLLATAPLGQGRSLHLVEINGKKLVIGSTINNINLLTELDPEYENFLYSQNAENQQLDDDITSSQTDEPTGYSDLYKEYLTKD